MTSDFRKVEMIKILVVDDEREILDEIAEALTDEGYEAVCADRVDAALEILRNQPDIGMVVTDLKMPGKTGVDLINEARAEFERDIAFIVMSGSPDNFGLDLKEFPVLRKPLDIDKFLEAVQTALSLKGAQDRNRRPE